ncbi:cache domain-containing protein [Mycetocola sp.]|uniref:cache domain-containing protein n=1 Tax=Mycetocola sp. TaxID=1871042 RepID=UPI003989790E
MSATTAPTSGDAAVSALDSAAGIVSAYFGRLLPMLEEHASRLAREITEQGGKLTVSRVDDIVEPHARAILDFVSEPIYGAGFIATVGVLADAPSHLAWWQGEDRRKLVFPARSVKQGIDYRELEWFRVPLLSGKSHVAGPYVDYLCSDEYTMTAASPVTVDGTFVGVAGLDVLIETIERRLTPPLRALRTSLVLVNGVSRVLVSTDPRFSAGDVLRPDLVRERRACEAVALEVVELA